MEVGQITKAMVGYDEEHPESVWCKVTQLEPLEAKLLNNPLHDNFVWGEIVRLQDIDQMPDGYPQWHRVVKHEGVVDETEESLG